MVVAGTDPIEHRARHVDAQRLTCPLLDREGQVESAASDVELDIGFIGRQLPLDDVAWHVAVDPNDLVAGQDADPRCRRPCGNRHDHRCERARRCSSLDVALAGAKNVGVDVDRV